MAVSRRGFLRIGGADSDVSNLGAIIAARGHEAYQAEMQAQGAATQGQGQGRAGGAGGRGGGQGGRGGRPPLPEGVDENACDATFRDGVLEVTLAAPNVAERRGRKVEIR